MRLAIRQTTLAAVALLVGLGAPSPALAGKRQMGRRIIEGLSHPRYKVRLQAAIRAGKAKISGAIPKLRKMVDSQQEREAVRAAAIVALAAMADEASRGRFAYLLAHKSKLIALAAEKALIALDRSMERRPYYLVSVARPVASKGATPKRAQRVLGALNGMLKRTGGVVLAAREGEFLNDDELAAHLRKRDLEGLLIKPRLLKLEVQVDADRTTVIAELELKAHAMVDRRLRCRAIGGADSWIEDGAISTVERSQLVDEVLQQAAESALMQLLRELSDTPLE